MQATSLQKGEYYYLDYEVESLSLTLNPELFTILVVDDIKKNLQLLSEILEKAGYEINFATSGKQAIKRLKTAPPDLILLDLMMPDMNGLEVCATVKANSVYQSIPIIFITGNQDKDYLVQAFKQGAADYITKPFQEQEILARIKNQLRLQRQERQLQNLAQKEQEKAAQLEATLQELKQTQTQLIQAQKLASLSQTVAAMNHEINNPISFISGNLHYANSYFQDLLSLIQLYQDTYPNPSPEILQQLDEIELDFIAEDWAILFNSLQNGTERISQLMLSLRHFSRLDEADLKATDINQDIDQVLTLLQHRLQTRKKRSGIQVIKHYSQLPQIYCYPSQLNQVLINLFNNAIEALEEKAQTQAEPFPEPPTIIVRTKIITDKDTSNVLIIQIEDNGCGIDEAIQPQIFDPFFTTKPVGTGTGLGLAISYQIIVNNHKGNIHCVSTSGKGTQMIIEIPTTASIKSLKG